MLLSYRTSFHEFIDEWCEVEMRAICVVRTVGVNANVVSNHNSSRMRHILFIVYCCMLFPLGEMTKRWRKPKMGQSKQGVFGSSLALVVLTQIDRRKDALHWIYYY